MNKEKLYFNRRAYNQWKGKDIAVEEELNGYGLYVQIPDMDLSEGSINTIVADFRNQEGAIFTVGCEIYDASKRIIRIEMPLSILSNDDLYEVTFSISYNSNGEASRLEKTAIQTFTILDTIEVTDEEIENDDRYSILTKLIEDLAQYKVDTSTFAKTEEVEKMIDEAMEGVTIESITSALDGMYVTPIQMSETLKSYVTKFDSAQFAKTTDLNAYLKIVSFNSTMSNYAKISELAKYVLKEEGKGLSSNDLTDALYNKLVNMPETGAEFDDSELKKMISEKADMKWVVERFDNWDTISREDYYDITTMDKLLNEIKENHSADLDDLNNNVENIYLKKEDYGYLDGINTDDVKVDDTTNLTQLLKELSYKEIEIEKFETTLMTNIYELGVDSLSSVSFRWTLNRNPVFQSIPNHLNTINTELRFASIMTTIRNSIDFTLAVSDEKVTKEKTISIQFVSPYYYGTYTTEYLNVNEVILGRKIVDIKKNQIVTMSYNNSKIFFAYPSAYGNLIDIRDGNGLSYFDDFSNENMLINGVSYIVYTLGDKASVSNISFSFIFEKEENK